MSCAARWALATLLLALYAAPATAHLTPNSEVQLAIGHDAIRADVIVPRGEYAFATGNPVGNDARSLAFASDYLASHEAIVAPDGRPWTRRIERIEFAQIAGPPDLHAVENLIHPA